MKRTQDVTIDGVSYTLYGSRGKVMSSQKNSETHVSGTISGGTHNRPISGSISSTTVTTQEFFLRNNEGVEKDFSINTFEVPMRAGHDVEVFWGIKKGKKYGAYFAVKNFNTDNVQYVSKGTLAEQSVFYSTIKKRVLAAVAFVSTWVLFSLAIGNDLIEGSVGLFVFFLFLSFVATYIFEFGIPKGKAERYLNSSEIQNFVNNSDEVNINCSISNQYL